MTKEQCKEMIWDAWTNRNCSRLATRDGYCKQHHPDTVAERIIKSEKDFKRKQEHCPWTRLAKAHERIKELEKEIKTLRE